MLDHETERLLRRDEAAAYLQNRWGLRTSRQTLAKKAVTGDGPIYRLAGRFPLYQIADLDAYAKAQISAPRRSTSERVAA